MFTIEVRHLEFDSDGDIVSSGSSNRNHSFIFKADLPPPLVLLGNENTCDMCSETHIDIDALPESRASYQQVVDFSGIFFLVMLLFYLFFHVDMVLDLLLMSRSLVCFTFLSQ